MAVIDDPANSDSDEYLPKAPHLPKLNNKRTPSASRIAAQSHKKHHTDCDEPKQDKKTKDNRKIRKPQRITSLRKENSTLKL